MLNITERLERNGEVLFFGGKIRRWNPPREGDIRDSRRKEGHLLCLCLVLAK
jgi:hypothetical protein